MSEETKVAPEAQQQPNTVAPSTPVGGSPRKTDTSPLIGFGIVGAFLYKFWVWDQLSTQRLRLTVTGAVVAALLIAAVFFWKWTKGREALRTFTDKAWLITVLALTVLGAAGVAVSFDGNDRALGLKLFAIAFFSIFPALLYWQFLARRGRALWDEYVLNLFRLHVDRYAALPEPPATSLFYPLWHAAREQAPVVPTPKGQQPKVDLYRKKFEGVFGRSYGGDQDEYAATFFRGDNAMPVIVLTILLSVGWVVVIQPEAVLGVVLWPPFEWSGLPAVPLQELRYAFLGAYFFIVQMLVRRYYQNDLKTNAYISATVRIVVVVLITWIVGSTWTTEESEGQRIALAFVIGVFPEIGWQFILRYLKKIPRVNIFDERYPLNSLDGLNLWYATRLEEEGVEDLQTLVTANIVDLMLHTRVPVERLVDWIDQAVLYLHIGADDKDGKNPDRTKLRRCGIRSATDLLDVYDPKGGEAKTGAFKVPNMEKLLDSGADGPNVMLSLVTALDREPALYYVDRWKSFPFDYLLPEMVKTNGLASFDRRRGSRT